MRNLPSVTRHLLIINVLMFLATYVFQRVGIDLTELLGLHFFMAENFRLYQFVTYMFMHGGLAHLFFNMFALWMFGCVVERVWGSKKFLFYYIVCGIGAGIIQELAQYVSYYIIDGLGNYDYVNLGGGTRVTVASFLNQLTTVGASGAIYGILLAFGMLFPEERIFIFPLPVPIKAKWFVCGYVAIELLSAMGTQGDGVAHFAHLGGMLFGFLLILYWRNHPQGGAQGGSGGQQYFERMRRNWEQRAKKRAKADEQHFSEREKDWQFNEQKQANQEEIDAILDKIRRSGYDSLTEEEKKKLFDAGRS